MTKLRHAANVFLVVSISNILAHRPLVGNIGFGRRLLAVLLFEVCAELLVVVVKVFAVRLEGSLGYVSTLLVSEHQYCTYITKKG